VLTVLNIAGVVLRQSFRRFSVEPVHHYVDPLADEHLHGIGRAVHRVENRLSLLGTEPAEHVARQIPSRFSAADADPQPRELIRPELLGHRLEPVVAAGRSAAPRAEPSERQVHVVGNHQQVGDLHLVEVRQGLHRLAAQVHERERLGEDDRRGAVRPAHQCAEGLAIALDAGAPRDLVDHLETDVVPRVAVLRAGVSESDDQLQLFASSFSTLPFLMTSGSAGVVGVAVAAAASAAGASSTLMATTCTSIVSGSLIGVHF